MEVRYEEKKQYTDNFFQNLQMLVGYEFVL